jgi:hypothetical protein
MYNISDIQKGIQAGHAALEYAHLYNKDKDYQRFMEKYKTWIILNGGTSNVDGTSFYIPYKIECGTMEQIELSLHDNEIKYSAFFEPDLNNATSALCFLVDERVFNKKDYPELFDFSKFNSSIEHNDLIKEKNMNRYNAIDIIKENNIGLYNEWVKLLGGEKNVFLRELLRDKKLA